MKRSPAGQDDRDSWSRRLAWLAVLWAASVASLGVIAAALKFVMRWAGLTT